MSVTLPTHIASLLGLQATAGKDEFSNRLFEYSTGCNGLLASDEAREFVCGLLSSPQTYVFENYPSYLRNATPRYCEVYLDGNEWFSLSVFSEIELSLSPPGKIEEEILARWIADDKFSLQDWNTKLKGNALLKWASTPPVAGTARFAFAYELISAICEAAVDERVSPLFKASIVEITENNIQQQQSSIQLLGGALTEKNPKWRFLSLYRILENGYLGELLKKINTDFFYDPDRTLTEAQKSLKSEVAQFNEYVKSKNLESQFEDFSVRFDELIGKQDHFTHAIKRNIDGTTDSNWKAGMIRAYKIRCAIAHAGSGDTYVELHPGWKASLEYLLPPLEEAALLSQGITVS